MANRGETIMKTVKVKQKRVLYYSVLNVLACMGVVILHCNSVALSGAFPERAFFSAFLIHSLLYWPVPIFFMLSGATLMDYRERYDTKTFMKKRLLKTLIPFLFWTFVALIWWSLRVNGGSFDFNPVHVVSNIFNTAYINHYWFFIPLFGIYLALPVLSAVQDKLRLFKYASILGIVFVAFLPLFCNVFDIQFNSYSIPPIFGGGGFILYVFLGYCLSRTNLTKWQRIGIYSAGLLGFVVYYFGTLYLINTRGYFAQTFLGVTNLPLVLISIAVFTFFKYFNFDKLAQKLRWFPAAIERLASVTFGIYLIHGFFTESLPWILGFNPLNIIWRTVGGIGLFALCALIVMILKRVPVIRRLVP